MSYEEIMKRPVEEEVYKVNYIETYYPYGVSTSEERSKEFKTHTEAIKWILWAEQHKDYKILSTEKLIQINRTPKQYKEWLKTNKSIIQGKD